MSIEQFLIAELAAALLAVVAAGLLVRRRVVFCWSFLIYVLTALTFGRLITYWPERFWNYSFTSMVDTVLTVIKILIALEVWQRSFSALPRARVRVGLLLAAPLVVTAMAVLTIPVGLHPFRALVGILSPRQNAGTLALYAIIVSAASWYRVPLHPLHRAILIGFAAYLTVNVSLQSLVGWHSFGARAFRSLSTLDQVVYNGAAAWWAWAAWRPVRAPSPVVSRLQPWAHSW